MTGPPEQIDAVDLREVVTLPAFDDIDHGQLFALSLSNDTTSLTHGLHRFAAKFIPQIPAWALDNFGGRDSVVVDPFVGSGTTLVEGLIRGGTTIGVDIDPLARLIARAKTTTADRQRVCELAQQLRARWVAPAPRLRAPMPDIDNFDHWFSPTQWGWLQSLRDAILGLECSDDEGRFLLAVFSSALRWTSNADDQSQKTYVSGTLVKTPPAVQDVFWHVLDRAIEGLADLERQRHSDAKVVIPETADATALGLDPESVDLAITSPPYLDSVDYPYNMMLEYFWLGPLLGVPDRKTFNALRRRPIGAKSPAQRAALPASVDGLIKLDLLPPARRAAASTYFSLLERHFVEVARTLKAGSRYVFVVGNSQTRSDVVPVHEALVQLAAAAGFELERAFGYRIRRHYMKFPRRGRGGIILIDWVLVLRKQASANQAATPPLRWVTLAPDAVAH